MDHSVTNAERQRPSGVSPLSLSPVIEVFAIRSLDPPHGSLKAFCDVALGIGTVRIKICDCRIIRDGDKAAWVSLPQAEWKGDDGKRRYKPILDLDGKTKKVLQEKILAAWGEQ